MSNYTVSKKTTLAAFPREENSTIFSEDQLSIVYNKYKTTNTTKLNQSDVLKVNLIFAHGTGMNKSIWDYHINKLYKLSESSHKNWILDSVVSIDAVSHGDSALINEDYLGWAYDWRDGAKDIIEVIKREQRESKDFLVSSRVKNIIIGHSMGGYQALYAGFLEGTLFDSIISIEPVIYGDENSGKRFKKILPSLQRIIKSEFKNEAEYEKFFKKMSFYRNFDPRIMETFMADEFNQKGDLVKLKASQEQQIICYSGAALSIPVGMAMLPFIKPKVLHIIGSKASWNPQESIEFLRSSIPDCKGVNIKEGEHLVNCERPDDIIKEFELFINERVEAFTDNKLNTNDRKAIFEKNYKELIGADFATFKSKL